MPLLKNWTIFNRFSNTYNKEMPYLTGEVYNDKRFPDGSEIVTTAVLEFKENYARTKNTEYKLL